MRFILVLILLTSANIFAKEVATNSFSITLPDSLHVETDKSRRLLAFGDKGPGGAPFLSIEFGTNIEYEALVQNVNASLKNEDLELSEEVCEPDCKSFYFEQETPNGNRFHYLVQSREITFIISYLGNGDLESDGNFVKNVGAQILENSI